MDNKFNTSISIKRIKKNKNLIFEHPTLIKIGFLARIKQEKGL